MDAVSATTASSTTSATGSAATPATTGAPAAKSFAARFAEAKQELETGESLTKVDGHEFGRIKGGTRDDLCINLSGNARSGQAFDLVWRNGRQFHVYGGTGAEHTVVEVGKKAATTKTDAATTTGATTTTTSGGTAAAGAPSS